MPPTTKKTTPTAPPEAAPAPPEAAPAPDDEQPGEASTDVVDLLGYCPTRNVCFPYGQPVDAHHMQCIHGEAFAPEPAEQ